MSKTKDPQITLQLLNDQEIADAAKDPEGMAIIQDVTQLQQGSSLESADLRAALPAEVIMNPSNLELHKQNPRVANLVAKLESWPQQ